jgi:hypothetical protein
MYSLAIYTETERSELKQKFTFFYPFFVLFV